MRVTANIVHRFIYRIYWWLYRIFFFRGHRTFDETVAELNTPRKVQAWMFASLEYEEDRDILDHWQPPERTFERKAGDCEDWAVFAMRCLSDEYLCRYLVMYKDGAGHVTLLIDVGLRRDDVTLWQSVGTAGFYQHELGLPYMVEWWGYEDWTDIELWDEDMETIFKW